MTGPPSRVLLGTAEAPAQRQIALDEHATLAALSPGGARVLAIEHRGNPGSRLVELDGQRTDVRFDAADDRRIDAAAYGADGETVFFAARSPDGRSRVFRIGRSHGRSPTLVYEPTEGVQVIELSSSARSPSMAALTTSPEGMGVVLLQPGGYRPYRAVPLPAGMGTLGSFSRDGRVLTITWETSQGPSDLYEVTTDLGKLREVRADVRPALATLEDMEVRRVRIPAGSRTLELTMYAPVSREKSRPAVLVLGQAGRPPAWRPAMRYLAGKGLVVLEPWTSMQGSDPTADELRGWMAALETWLGTQPWWARGRRAVIVRGGAAEAALDAVPHAWAMVVDPSGAASELTADGAPHRDGPVLVAAHDQTADAWVAALRRSGTSVEHAVAPDPASRLARETLFLQRVLGAATGP